MRNINSQNTLNAYTINGNEILVGDHFGYKIIAVIYDEETWCAYRGLTDWDDSRVATNGDQIGFDIAELLFPTIAQTHLIYYNP